ncbi:MAG: hypothetical protein KBA71_07880 [Opitutaceae bacterium]|nr:hypothetical protein [Opitutaceae bacterium]
MNSTPPPSPGRRWDELLARARTDQPPSLNLAPVLHAVTTAASDRRPAPSWAGDFAAIFGAPRTLGFCLCCAVALMLLTTWQMADALPALSWAEVLATDSGAAS